MRELLKLGLIQMTIDEDKKKCLERATNNIALLSDKGANCIVLPEMFNCPYDTRLFDEYAEERGEETWKMLSEAARVNAVYLIGGSIPEREGDYLYNTCFIFDPLGREIGRHRKIHLFDVNIKNAQYFKESDVLSAGESPTVVTTQYGKIGVGICYDVRFPELARAMVKKGAQVLVYPGSFNLTTGPVHWEMLFRARAVDNQVFMVGCAPARDEKAHYTSYGHSLVVNPWGDIVGSLRDEEGYLLGHIDLTDIRRVRDQLPILKHLKEGIY